MDSHEQLVDLTALVIEAVGYRRRLGDNRNPALGRAILLADEALLPWTRRQIEGVFDDSPPDAENLVAEAGVEALVGFTTFRGLTGGEFLAWEQKIVLQLVAQALRLRAARRKGGVRLVASLEGDAQAARLAALLESPELSPEQRAMMRENVARVRRALRGLSVDQRRVVEFRVADFSLRDIAAAFDRSAAWVQDTWEAAAHELRRRLLRRRRTRRKAAVA